MGKFQKKYYDILKSIYPDFEKDFNKEYSKQKMAIELIKLRLESGFTQEQFEELTGVAQAHLSRIENTTTNPKLSTIIQIAAENGYRLEIKFKKDK